MLSIAVCDDEVIECCNMAKRIKDILEDMKIPCIIRQFQSGGELLQALESFDIVFLDIIMQDLDGMKTAQIFREKAFDKILIFISSSREYVFDAYDVEAFQYLLKPVDNRKLKRVLQKAVLKTEKHSQASMTAIISAGTSMKQAKAQGSVAAKMEGRAGVLESEIKLDQTRGNDTQKKEEELADVQQKAQAATSSQLSTLADASKTMEEAAKADSKEEKTDDKDAKNAVTKGNGSDENASGVDTMEEMHSKGETVSGAESVDTKSDVSVSSSTAAAETTAQQPTAYKSVDIRL